MDDTVETNLWKELQNLREHKSIELAKNEATRRLPEPPKLVISVIGDSSSFVPTPWLTSVFQTGLIETAKGAKDCLILYKGSSEKVSSIVREAVLNFQRLQTDKDDDFISLVGILPEESPCESCLHRHKDQQYGWKYWEKSNCVFGDIYNIVMANDRYPEFHASMIKGITKNKTLFMILKGKSLMWHMPVLTIVAEGDLDTIECVHQLLKQDLPVLILKGTGKAADFIADFIEDSNTDSANEYVKDKTPLMFGVISHGTQLSGLPKLLTNIKENKCLVTFVDIRTQTKPEEFTDAVTNAVIRGWSRWKTELNTFETNDLTDYNLSDTETDPEADLLDVPSSDTIYLDDTVEKVQSVVYPQNNKIHPMTVTMNAVLGFGNGCSKDIGKFMESYKETLTPASLSLYYYIAYQFIQQMHENEKRIKIENFNILLKEAIVADRHDYVSVLLEEEGVKFDAKYFPEIYQETLISSYEEDTDFQNISKWGSSAAVESLREWCYITKIGNFLAKVQELLKRNVPLKSLVYALQNWKKESTDFQGESSQTTDDVWKRENSQHSKITKKVEMSVLKVDDALHELDHIKTEAFNLLLYCEYKDLNDKIEIKEKIKHLNDLIQHFKHHADSFKSEAISFKTIAKEQIESLHDSQSKMSVQAEKVCELFIKISALLEDLASLIKEGVKKKFPNEDNILDKSINEICISCSEKCIKAGRNICLSLLGYPKDNNQPTSDSVFQDLLVWAILVNRPKLATIFWMKCKNQLLCALLASSAYKKMAQKVKSARDQSFYDEMMEQFRLFAERAVDLQRRLYDADANLAMDLVITEETVWDITISPLECAHENSMLDFIAQTCPQRRLNKIWYNEIGASLGGFWKKGCLTGCCCCCNFVYRCFFKCGCCCECGCCCKCTPVKFTFMLLKFVQSPLTKFLVHYTFFLAALVCYSAFLLTELDIFDGVGSIKVYEWIFYVYFLGDYLEEYRKLILKEESILTKISPPLLQKDGKRSLRHSWWYFTKRYLYNFWNCLDYISYLITFAAISIRFFKSTTSNNLARRFYSLSLFTMYMRFLHVILMSRKLGPKIIMIKEMLKDLFRFIGILFVFMMGVGVLYHANMYPKHVDMWNPAGWEYWRIWKIIYIPYWQIYGDSFLDTFSENSTAPCTTIQSEWENNPDIERCSQYDWVLVVIAALYMLISNLLLVNLVIALFSYRFERVQENSEKLWRYLRYDVIMDYKSRIPAPLNLIIRPLLMMCGCLKKSCNKRKEHTPDERLVDRIKTLQSIHAVNCVHNI
ncbi:unnamed protein product [Mytilus coruscus]|uniref:TRPM2 n=1 Tax=Mytilus coruscus TaxID=42192 RepID=A0A6J8B7H8_MYTCO|nr:unnamed protein product [Mytilus coruscus]